LNPRNHFPSTPDSAAPGTTFPLPPIHPENRNLQNNTLPPGHFPVTPGNNTGNRPAGLPDTFVPTRPPPVPVPKSSTLKLPDPITDQAGFHARRSSQRTAGFIPMRTLRVTAAPQQQQALHDASRLTGHPVRSHRSDFSHDTARDGWRVMRPYYD
jgi:hypothetical protein